MAARRRYYILETIGRNVLFSGIETDTVGRLVGPYMGAIYRRLVIGEYDQLLGKAHRPALFIAFDK